MLLRIFVKGVNSLLMVSLHCLQIKRFKGIMFHAWIVRLLSAYRYLWLRFFQAPIDCLIITHKAFIDKCLPAFEADAGERW